jgi:hypothetical protein
LRLICSPFRTRERFKDADRVELRALGNERDVTDRRCVEEVEADLVV